MYRTTLFVACFAATLISNSNAAEVILNEYSAVSLTKLLDGGTGEDSTLGIILGNGGNWFELLVIEDHVDMRGWEMKWAEDEVVENEETAAGTITLSNDDIWSDLRSGSIVTIIETANGGDEQVDTETDISYDPLNGDWWINVATQTEQAKGEMGLASTMTNDGVAGDFSVGKDDWTLTLLNANGETVFGPVGEGAEDWAGGGINSEEAGSLEGPIATADKPLTQDVWRTLKTSSEFYDDTGTSSFGTANVDFDVDANQFVTIQDLSALRNPVLGISPPGDFNEDGMLAADDLDALSEAVRGMSEDLKFDVNEDGAVTDADRDFWILGLKSTWLGDSNLDGAFDSSDFVSVFTIGQYEDGIDNNSTWASGDWNGDTEFDSSDFVAAFTGGGFEIDAAAAPAIQAVPEPSGLLLITTSLLLGLFLRRN